RRGWTTGAATPHTTPSPPPRKQRSRARPLREPRGGLHRTPLIDRSSSVSDQPLGLLSSLSARLQECTAGEPSDWWKYRSLTSEFETVMPFLSYSARASSVQRTLRTLGLLSWVVVPFDSRASAQPGVRKTLLDLVSPPKILIVTL